MNAQRWQAAWQQLIAPGSPFEVLDRAEDGTRSFRHAPANLLVALDAGRAHGDREFLVWGEQRLSFAQYFDQVDRLAGQLHETFGVRPGDRVAIAMRNQPAWLVAFVAVQRCGAVCVPLNSWGLRDELLHGLQDSGARVLLCDEPRWRQLEADLAAGECRALVIGLAEERHLPEGSRRYEEVLAAPMIAVPTPSITADAPALILYTSGTTSRAKGVLSSHRAVCQALTALEFQGAFSALGSPERIATIIQSGFAPTLLMAVPLFHVSGLYAQFLLALRGGRRIVLMYKWEVETALDLIRDERCTQFNGAPVMMQQLLASPRFGSADTASLFGMGLGGGASSRELLASMAERRPEAIGGSGFGLTESNGIGAAIGGDQFLYKPQTVGWPLPVVDVRIGEHPDRPLPTGSSGLIWLRSPTLMDAYWNLPEASAQTLRDGWLDTGDLGHLDDEGYLCVTGRLKDLINRGGEKISAVEVEECACQIGGVTEAAAFAMADPLHGEAVALVIAGPVDGLPESGAVMAFIGERLAAYKVPVQVFRQFEPLPRNASGKVLKAPLKERWAC